jgi:hypothetical protein
MTVFLAGVPMMNVDAAPAAMQQKDDADSRSTHGNDGNLTALLRLNGRETNEPIRQVAQTDDDFISAPLQATPPVPAIPAESIAEPLPYVDEHDSRAAELPPVRLPEQSAVPTDTATGASAPESAAGPTPCATWEDDYNRRLAAVLQGTDPSANQGAAAQWHNQSSQFQTNNRELVQIWHDESIQFQQNNRHLITGSAQSFRKHGPKISALEYPVDEEDLYNSRPIIATLGPVRTAAGFDEQGANGQVGNASQRLTRDISTIQPTLSYAFRGIDETQLPDEFFDRMDNGEYVARTTSPTVLQWAPSNLWHNPAYFEDPALERYGHTYHPLVQPFASSARFSTQLIGLPYQMALHPVHTREYALGFYRPGDYAPKLHYQIPFNQEATLAQAAAIAGFLIIFP